MDLFSEAMRRNPYPLYEEMRGAAPLFHLPQFGLWFLFDYENVKRAVNDPTVFSSAAAQSDVKPFDWLVFSDPPRHTKWRAIIMRAFTPRMVANLEPRIRELSRTLLSPLLAHGQMDLVADYSARLPLLVIAEMLGIPLDDQPLFKQWSDAIVNLSNSVTGGEQAIQATSAFGAATAEMRPYLDQLLQERRAAPRDDLLTRLAEAEVDGKRLNDTELLGFFQLLLLAGSETTTNLINNAMLCFLEHPQQHTRLRAQPELLPMAIEEVLRYRAPVQAVFRITTCDVVVHGQTIPAGSLVLPLIGSANRDANQFAEPERFDITRDPNPHVAFGHGPHFCLGAPLARLEARIALEDLLSELEGVRLASDEPWEPREAFHVHGPTRLPILFEPSRQEAVID